MADTGIKVDFLNLPIFKEVVAERDALRSALQALYDAAGKAETVWAYGGNGEGWNIADVMEELLAARVAAGALLEGDK